MKAEREPVGAMRAEIEKAFSPLETSPLRKKPLDAYIAASEEPAMASPQPAEPSAPLRSAPNRFDPVPEPAPAPRSASDVSFVPKSDRRKADRRGMDALRDEALKTIISRVEDKNFGGLRNQVHWSRGMNRMRIILVLVALIAGGLAAYLATQTYAPEPAPVAVAAAAAPEVVAAPTTQVLVAKTSIAVGESLTPDLLEWAAWPDSALRPEYITTISMPDAMTEMSKSAARVQFFAGEPIRTEKLGEAGKGLLATLIDKGKRGVSVSVAAESAAGGFIVPDDRVDVVLTRATANGQASNTIVHNVRVLGINAQVIGTSAKEPPVSDGEPAKAESFGNTAIATLELDPAQAEVMINSTAAGKLSLVLRPTLDVAETPTADQQATNQEIRITSPFWSK